MESKPEGPFWGCELTRVNTMAHYSEASSLPPWWRSPSAGTTPPAPYYTFSSNVKCSNLLLLFRENEFLLCSAFKPLRWRKTKGCCQLYQFNCLIWAIGLFSTVQELLHHLVTAKAKAKSDCSWGPRWGGQLTAGALEKERRWHFQITQPAQFCSCQKFHVSLQPVPTWCAWELLS